MALKLFKGVWMVSVLAVVANLLYVYASLPVEVLISGPDQDALTVSRETIFYIVVPVVALINSCVYFFESLLSTRLSDFRTWFYAMVISLNTFFIVAMSFVGIYNSNEHYDFSKMGMIVYASIVLLVLIAIIWPVYILLKRLRGLAG